MYYYGHVLKLYNILMYSFKHVVNQTDVRKIR